MNYIKVCLFTFVLLFGFHGALAQDHHDQKHEEHSHHDEKNEIGGALGVVFDLNEHNTSSGLHLHYTRMFGGKLKKVGVAPGLEFVFGEHKHYALQLMLVYRPFHGWWISAGPGISYFDHHDELQASGHIETGYEFDAGKVHFGPVVEYSWVSEDQHIMLGLHLGVPF